MSPSYNGRKAQQLDLHSLGERSIHAVILASLILSSIVGPPPARAYSPAKAGARQPVPRLESPAFHQPVPANQSAACNLYPIALSADALTDVTIGDTIPLIFSTELNPGTLRQAQGELSAG